jgi:hypothetical protein
MAEAVAVGRSVRLVGWSVGRVQAASIGGTKTMGNLARKNRWVRKKIDRLIFDPQN